MTYYPGTIFEYIDQSAIEPLPVAESIYKPLYMMAITSDKGPEDYRVVQGADFFKLYGNTISFAKHGQPLLQAAVSINAGARLFVRRVVAEDSTLANLAIIADVKKVEVQKVDADGNPLYTDSTTGAETSQPKASDGTDNTPIMITKAKIKYEAKTVENAKAMSDIYSVILGEGLVNPTVGQEGKYPLFVISDIGRGVSNKNFQITPDYASSKSTDYTRYMFNIFENNQSVEGVQFAFNPTIIDNNVNVAMEARINTHSKQVRCDQYESYIETFMGTVAQLAGLTLEDFGNMDILFGKTKKGEAVPTIEIDTTGISLSHSNGIRLESGDNGLFGNAPINTVEYDDLMAKVFDGGYGDEIYDLDNYKIDLVIDANYPADVKRAIEKLVTFREDCTYLRDLGLNLDTLELILGADRDSMKNKFCASYHNSYDIIDPYSKKQITVSIGYSLSKLMVPHFINGRNRPLAGQLYGMILTDAIEGTLNFKPTINPIENQKTTLDDARINYASYFDNVLVIETLYNSQEKLSQFSFVNNILAIQQVIKAIRTLCPKIRYSFIDGDDLKKYQKDVQSVIDRYSSDFLSITLEYIEDPVYVANKVFLAAIKVQFRNFVQTEWFRVIALPS